MKSNKKNYSHKWKYFTVSIFFLLTLLLAIFVLTKYFKNHQLMSSTNQSEAVSTATNSQTEAAIVSETTIEQLPLENEFLFEGLDKKEQSEPYVPTENKITLRSVGDILIHDRVSFMADTQSEIYQNKKVKMLDEGFDSDAFNEELDYDFAPMLAYIKPYIEYADISVANMEVIAGHPTIPVSGYPSFNAPQEILPALKDIGIDILSNATNHTLDWSSEGVHASLSNMNEYGLMYYGSFDSWEDYQTPRIIDKNGIKLGFLAYSYGTNGIPVPVGEEYLVNLIDLPVMLKEVEQLQKEVDAVIVSLQLGGEYDTLPNDEQFYIYQALSDAGVKLILGGHPHCLQPYDWYNEGQTFAIYSQASFLTGQRELDNKLGGITEISFIKNEQGEIIVDNPKFMPIFSLGIENEKMYQTVPLADFNFQEIPDGQSWWDTIKERMEYYTEEVDFVSHLETKSSHEAKATFQ